MLKSLIFQVIVCCTLTRLSLAAYDLDFLTDNCVPDPSLRVLNLGQNGRSTYGLVRLTRYNDYGTNLNCGLRIVAPVGYSLFVKIAWVDIHATTSFCDNNVDYLRVTAVNSYPPFDVYYCGRGIPEYSSLAASSGTVDIRFISGSVVSSDDAGFELHYNVYHAGGNCSSNEWKCTDSLSDWCILEELVCDNMENCFDGADEWNCGLSSGGMLAIIIISSVIGGAVIMFIVFIYHKRQKKKAQRVHSTTQSQPQSRQPRHAVARAGGGVTSSSSSSAVAPGQYTSTTPPPYSDPPPAYTFSAQYVNPHMQGAVTSPNDLNPVQVPPPPPTATIYPPVPGPLSRPPVYTELTAVEDNTPSVV